MGLDVVHRRPLARLAVRGAIQGITVPGWQAGPYAPPASTVDERLQHVRDDVGDVCVEILRGILFGEDLWPIRGHLAPDVVTWTPRLFAVTRDQLLTGIDAAELTGDALTEVVLDITHVSTAEARVFVEWRMSARFTGPGFIDDDLLVEPTGRLLETAGVEVVQFAGDLVVSVHCYCDDLALFEQVITCR